GAVTVNRRTRDEAYGLVLKPDQQLKIENGAAAILDVDAEAEMSWRHGVLDFDEETLAEAVEKFNRNSKKPLVINDARIESLTLSGVFFTDQPNAFAAALG